MFLRKLTAAMLGASVVVWAPIESPVALADTTTLDIVGPVGSGHKFGTRVVVLDNGNFVVTDPTYDSVSQPDVGAVYLYDGITNQLISTLRGSSAGDMVGDSGIRKVGSSNFIVSSQRWDGAAVDTGAVTWVNGATGLNATVSPANSLVGSSAGDRIGNVTVSLISATTTVVNYLVVSQVWNNGGVADAGSVTWGDGNVGVVGQVSPTNSLVGSSASDGAGLSATGLTTGSYAVRAPGWDRGAIVDAGAATFGNGTVGRVGVFDVSNSLVGTAASDQVGTGLTALANGNFVVRSPMWNNVAVADAGAVTWVNAAAPVTGPVTPANSLVGSTLADFVGTGVTSLSNGNYVVRSPDWNRGVIADAGAATWGSGSTGIVGPVALANSIVGGATTDRVSSNGVTALTDNGNYVVRSPIWNNGAVVDAGAATWANGSSAVALVVGPTNSLVGTTNADQVGLFGTATLDNGNYVVVSPGWNRGGVAAAGAVTFGNGTTGVAGPVTTANSIVGSTSGDQIGANGVLTLANSNFLIFSWGFDNGAVVDASAVTWVNGVTGGAGVVNAATSLVGSTSGESLGGGTALALSNGNYVLGTPSWDNGALADVGAVTMGNGATGLVGTITTTNSLIGTRASDRVGSFVVELADGNIVAGSSDWDNGSVVDAGAATWRSVSAPITGSVTSANSLVGSTAGDMVGSNLVTFDDGTYLAMSSEYNNGAIPKAGAVTFGDLGGIVGPITSSNSVRGQAANAGATMVIGEPATAAHAIVIGRPAENIVSLLIPPPRPNYVPLVPARLAETRPGLPTVDGLEAGGGQRVAGSTLELLVAGRGGVAADAVAAALNVTAVDALGDGFVTVYPCGSTRPTASSLNFTTGSVVPNAVITKLGTGGKVCIFVSQATHLVVDVGGFFPTTSSYISSNPARVLETRPGLPTIDALQQGAGKNVGNSITEVQIAGRADVPANATSVVLNVTVTEPDAVGFVTVFPCGEQRPTASNLNVVQGQTVANLVISKLGAGGKVCIYAQIPTHLVVDVNGYFPAVTTYRSLSPARLLESRPALFTIDGLQNDLGIRPAGTVTTLPVFGRGGVPANAATVVLNVTVTEPAGDGFVTVYPCGESPPVASNLNFVAGQTVANAVVVKVGTSGNVCLFNSNTTHLVADVSGYIPSIG